MSDKELIDYMNKIEPNFDSHLEKGTIEISLEYYNLLEERMARLINENEELKKQLEVGEEQYNNLVEEKEKLEEQLSSITLELEEYKKQVNKGLYSTCLPYKTGYDKAVEDYKKQQQEFVKYLEDKINYFKDLEQFAIKTFNNKAVINLDLVKRSIEEDNLLICNFEEIFQKYKEIIGVSNEK